MRNISLLFVLLLLLNSCSSDSTAEVAPPTLTTNGSVIRRVDQLLPTEVVSDGLIYYNGNKLDKIGNNVSYQKFIYTGNLITQMLFYENNALTATHYFNYDGSERLIERKILNQDGTGIKTVYTYNSDGTCSVQLFRGNQTTQNTVDDLYNKKVFFANGQVDKIETYRIIAGNPVTLTVSYGYDNKRYPYDAILGYSKLTFYELGNHGNINNIVSYTYSDGITPGVDIDLVEYTYNTYDFPATMKVIDHPDSGTTNYDMTLRYMYDLP